MTNEHIYKLTIAPTVPAQAQEANRYPFQTPSSVLSVTWNTIDIAEAAATRGTNDEVKQQVGVFHAST